MKRILLILMVIFIGCTPISTPVPTLTPTIEYCNQDEVGEYANNFSLIFDQWTDLLALAQKTQRINLPDQISQMQSLKREFDKLEYPPCLSKCQDYFMNYVEYTIDAYMAFLSDESDSNVAELFHKAGVEIDKSTSEINIVNNCVPNCKP